MNIEEFLEILACPKCKGGLLYNKQKNILICPDCSLVYTIEDEIPILLIEQAEPLDAYLPKN